MNTISKTYTLLFEIDYAPNYQFTKCGLCFNTKTGRQIKQVLNSGCIGYNILGVFKSLVFLRKHTIKTRLIKYPF